MTNRSINYTNITLPLLIAYSEVLLTSLVSTDGMENETRAASDGHKNQHADNKLTELLWVVEDKAELAMLRAQLGHGKVDNSSDSSHSKADNRAGKKADNNNSETNNSQLATLSVLARQPTLIRYELACFWLPTLSAEGLQHYIPLLMRYRDLYAAHLLIALDSTIDLRAYGFTPFDILSAQPPHVNTSNLVNKDNPTIMTPSIPNNSQMSLILWQFNLYDYKQLPNWLNANYWANPENWNKSRW